MLRTTYGILDDTSEHIRNVIRNTTAPMEAAYTEAHGQGYLRAYTDRSCTDGTRREKARAGWGVDYADNSANNHRSKLGGPVQTSYRAEIYAVLHVVLTASEPTLIHTDCLNAANTLTSYMLHGSDLDKQLSEND